MIKLFFFRTIDFFRRVRRNVGNTNKLRPLYTHIASWFTLIILNLLFVNIILKYVKGFLSFVCGLCRLFYPQFAVTKIKLDFQQKCKL